MSAPRFQVATCEGWPIDVRRLGGSSGRRKPGLSATVCDTLHMWQEIKTYRSEDRVPSFKGGGYRGREQAKQAAEDHATYLNRLYGEA